MRKTIFLPDDLGTKLEAYLSEHPNETASGVIQALLEMKLRRFGTPRDLKPLLALAGFVKDSKRPKREDLQPEDQVVLDEHLSR